MLNDYLFSTGGYLLSNRRSSHGVPLSLVIANLFMEFFEDLAINTSSFQPSLWLQYIDDTFVIWTHGDKHLHSFWNHLNSIRPSIQFTMEEESEGSIPFLDVLVRRREQQLETSVYRKATHTDSYIHYVSNHHPATKISIITCLKKRAISVCKGEYFKEELQHLTSTFNLLMDIL